MGIKKKKNPAILPQCALQMGERKIDSNQRPVSSSAKLGVFTTVTGGYDKGKLSKRKLHLLLFSAFFFISALRQGPLTTEQHVLWMNRSQIAEINPMQVGLILKISKQISLVNRFGEGWLEMQRSLELDFNKFNGVSKVNGEASRGLKHQGKPKA